MSNNRPHNALQSLVLAPYKDGAKTRALLAIPSTTSIVGYVVWTPYGTATVTDVRPKEAVVECRNCFGASCYLQFDKVVVIGTPITVPVAKTPVVKSPAVTEQGEKKIESSSTSYFSIVKWLFSSQKSNGAESAGVDSSGDTRLVSGQEKRLEAGIISSCHQRAFTSGDYVVCAPFGACVVVKCRVDGYEAGGEVVMYELRRLRARFLGMAGDEVGDLSMKIYSSAAAVTKFVRGELGQTLRTPYGPAVLLAVQPCGIHVVKSVDVPCMVMYLHPKCVWV